MHDRIAVIITSINKLNRNIQNLSSNSKKKNWSFIIIGDKKSPKNFSLKYGKYYNIRDQKKTNINFAKICPLNSYARKNIGYLLAIKNKTEVIIETDDDNYPKKNFFTTPKLIHKVSEIMNKNWVNIYDLFLKEKKFIWPRGLPLNFVKKNKIRLTKKKKLQKFYLQQGVCDINPDVDAIYRLINEKINIKFKNNFFVSLGKAYSPFNSQNTIWFKEIFPLLYLPVSCSMRATDIIRGLVAMKILQNDNKKALFYGTTVFQKRNEHNLFKDFEDEIPIYLNSKKIVEVLNGLKLKKGNKFYYENLLKCYKNLILHKIIDKKENVYLNSWLKSLKKIIN